MIPKPTLEPGGTKKSMSDILRAAGLAALLILPACGYLIPAHHQTTEPSELPEGGYRLDPAHTALLFKVDHLGFSQFVGRFDRVDASLVFDPEGPEASRLTVLVDMASIDVNPPAFAEELRGPDWFEVERFPEARFESRTIEVTGETTGIVRGDLTLHGVTRPVTLDVTFNGGGDNLITGDYTLGFAARGTLLRSDFGLGAYAPAIGDEVTLEISVEFGRTDGQATS